MIASEILSPQQKNIYSSALSTLLAYQNKDGSWGVSKEEKITITAQMIQLMLSLNVKLNEPVFVKASRWIEDNVNLGEPHWATKVEIELKIGNFQKLISDGAAFNAFFDALYHDINKPLEEEHIDLFWHVIPTLIELLPHLDELKQHGYTIPFEEINKRIEDQCYNFREDCIAVKRHPNHTGLIALYYSRLSKYAGFNEYKAKAEAMANWLIECKIEDASGSCWLNSKSITAYVLIDLLNSLDYAQIDPYISQITKFLLPSSKGIFKGDKNTTFNTKLHAESLYTTIVILRSIAELVKFSKSSSFDTLFDEVKNNKKSLFSNKAKRFFKNSKRKIPIVITAILTAIGIILYCCGLNEAGQIVVSTGVAGALGIFFDWILKPSD